MKCYEAKEGFYTYLDGQLATPQERNLYLHLSSCHDCQQEFRKARETHQLLEDSCGPVEPPTNMVDKVMERIAGEEDELARAESGEPRGSGWKEQNKWQKSLSAVKKKGWLVAAVLLSVVAGSVLLSEDSSHIAFFPDFREQAAPDGTVPPGDEGPQMVVPEKDTGSAEESGSGRKGSSAQTDVSTGTGETEGAGTDTRGASGREKGNVQDAGEEARDGERSPEGPSSSGQRQEPGTTDEDSTSPQDKHPVPEGPFKVARAEADIGVAPLLDGANNPSIKPEWSPAGDQLWYLEKQDSGKYLPSRADLDGSVFDISRAKAVEIFGGSGNVDWFPEKKRFAYVKREGKHLEIWWQGLDGRGGRLTPAEEGETTEYWAYRPRWSPRGDLLFSTNRFGSVDIMAVDSRGEEKVLARSADRKELYPAWSPGGEKIAYFSSAPGGGNEQRDNRIYVMNSGGSGKRAVTPHIAGDTLVPAWSPDGSKIAVNVGISEPQPGVRERGLWIVDADGTGFTKLTSRGGGRLVEWSPDGYKIAFTDASGALHVLVLSQKGNATGTLLTITDSASAGGEMDLTWSRDSEQLVIGWRPPESEQRSLWVANLPDLNE